MEKKDTFDYYALVISIYFLIWLPNIIISLIRPELRVYGICYLLLFVIGLQASVHTFFRRSRIAMFTVLATLAISSLLFIIGNFRLINPSVIAIRLHINNSKMLIGIDTIPFVLFWICLYFWSKNYGIVRFDADPEASLSSYKAYTMNEIVLQLCMFFVIMAVFYIICLFIKNWLGFLIFISGFVFSGIISGIIVKRIAQKRQNEYFRSLSEKDLIENTENGDEIDE
jgi:hypothetical protein